MRRQCWICYLEDDTDSESDGDKTCSSADEDWVQPCLCSGSTKWVHQSCLLSWIDKCLAGAASTPTNLACPQCHFLYTISEEYVVPRDLVRITDWLVSWRPAVSFGALIGGVAGSGWVLCSTYGVITFTFCVGPEEATAYLVEHGLPLWSIVRAVCFGTRVQENLGTLINSWWRLVVGMPAIPVAILSQKYRIFSRLNPLLSAALLLNSGAAMRTGGFGWTPGVTAAVLPWVYRGYQSLLSTVTSKIGLRKSISSLNDEDAYEDEEEEAEMTLRVSEDSVSTLLLFPAASALLGRLLFSRLDTHPFHRTCLGGAVLLVLGDAGRMLYRWQAEHARRSRKVLDHRVVLRNNGPPSPYPAPHYHTLSLL